MAHSDDVEGFLKSSVPRGFGTPPFEKEELRPLDSGVFVFSNARLKLRTSSSTPLIALSRHFPRERRNACRNTRHGQRNLRVKRGTPGGKSGYVSRKSGGGEMRAVGDNFARREHGYHPR